MSKKLSTPLKISRNGIEYLSKRKNGLVFVAEVINIQMRCIATERDFSKTGNVKKQ